MFKRTRYPVLKLRSKNELAKRISGTKLEYQEALFLINDVMHNHDKYWYDSVESEPEEEKFVRSAVGTPLGKLLKLVDTKILAPYDGLVPDFIFGGLSGKNHIQAASHLLGEQRNRTLLRLDIRRFFEQIRKERIFYFFYKKCGCSPRAARILSDLCCVPLGYKGSNHTEESLARGFATSSRLALWCNLDLFLRLNWKAKRELRKHDPRVAIFVDDVGITASRIDIKSMQKFSEKAEGLLAMFDPNQPLPINPKKKEIVTYENDPEHLGLRLGRNKLTMGRKTRSRRDRIRRALKQPISKVDKKDLLRKHKSYNIYQRQISEIEVTRET